jgi:dolichyl-phosphate beta-glucosyltransferase
VTLRSLSVIVPAYNEERRLPALLDAFENEAEAILGDAGFSFDELILVDDGSHDETTQLLNARVGSIPQLRVIRLPENRGKGAAVRTGMLAAAGDYGLMTDVDMATPLTEVGLLMNALSAGADIAIGSRGLPASSIEIHQPWYRELMGRSFNRMLRLLTGLPFHDTQCGFKLFRLDRVRPIFELQSVDGFAFDAEVLVIARRLGLTVSEIPVRWADDHRTTVGILGAPSSMIVDLVKIGWTARRPGSRARPGSAQID